MLDVLEFKALQEKFHPRMRELQDAITQELKSLDPGIVLTEDSWERLDEEGKQGGGGITRAFEGAVFEKAGVNTSFIFGAVSKNFAEHLKLSSPELAAAGISVIIHPKNPRVPTVHMNFRFLVTPDRYWLGGGADLTPYYPHVEDFQYFHKTWKEACAPHGFYEKFKAECDVYFTNHHRQGPKGGEMRGIGGFFFDHYSTGNWKADLEMSLNLSEFFIPSYFPIVKKRMDELFSKEEETFQLHRRGRYVEFNLLHDRGTIFGLKTNGRVESILISLPPRCQYSYAYAPKDPTLQKMMEYYYPHDWA